MQNWNDIKDVMVEIAATTNIYPRPSAMNDEQIIQRKRRSINENTENSNKTLASSKIGDDTNRNETITELRVNRNVTGILIPNKTRAVVRVLAPVMDEHGELHQDTRYVEWKTVNFCLEMIKIDIT